MGALRLAFDNLWYTRGAMVILLAGSLLGIPAAWGLQRRFAWNAWWSTAAFAYMSFTLAVTYRDSLGDRGFGEATEHMWRYLVWIANPIRWLKAVWFFPLGDSLSIPNMLLMLPVGFLLVFACRRLVLPIVICWLLPIVIETVQNADTVGRADSLIDLVANIGGGLVGVAAGFALIQAHRRFWPSTWWPRSSVSPGAESAATPAPRTPSNPRKHGGGTPEA